MTVDGREYARIADILRSRGWRIEASQNKGGRPSRKTIHSVAYPPDPSQPGMPFGTSTDPRARTSVYVTFRRAGVELDPRHLQRARRKRRRM
jgi:hypothetical protein